MIQSINATSSLSIQHQSTSRSATGTLSGVSSSGDDSQNSEQLHASGGGNYVVSSQGDTVSISKTGAKASKNFTTSSSSDLSGYSDAELQQMLQKGKITQAEYNAEISKRKQQEQQQNANSDATVTNQTSSTEQNNS